LVPLITSFAPSIRIQLSSRLQSHHRTNVLIDANDGTTKHSFTSDELFIGKEELSVAQLLPNGLTTTISNHTNEATLKTTSTELPRHIAFICDGNSRWSTRQSLPKSMGHAAGADRVINVIKALQRYQSSSSYSDDLDQTKTIATSDDTDHTITKATTTKTTLHFHGMIEYCTLYAFSTENWTRSPTEINTIFKLMERLAIQYRSHESVQSGKVQIDLLGNLEDERIPPGAKKELQQLQRESKVACEKRRDELGNSANVLTICLAINYGARADILQAAQKLAQSIASGEISPDAVMDESEISKRLCTAHIPDPDLIIRTSGETRLSNFLLWDAAYAELYFTDLLWPDFDDKALEEALVWYGKRKRRFGGRNE